MNFYWLVLVALVLTVAALALLLRSRFGARAGRHPPSTSSACGRLAMPRIATSSAAFVAGGVFAGLAGYLYAIQYGFVNPEIASWHQSGKVPC